MEEKFKQLKTKLAELAGIGMSMAVLGWDQQVNLPPGGAEDRGHALSTLASIAHEKGTSEEYGKLLGDLESYQKTLKPDSDEYRIIKVALRDYHKNTKISGEWVEEWAMATTLGQSAWEKAKHENNFKHFRPHLEKIVELRRQYASFFTPYTHVYDPLLDDFEPGMKTAEVKAIFDALRPRQVALLKAIAAKPQVDDSFLHTKFPEKGQWDFGVDVITRFGYDWDRGRQDKSVHPFTQSFGIGDVRITTHVHEDRAESSLFSTMHEGGHAMYEQGIDRKYSYTPLATGASMALHESQSRMWENLVGRSKAFWKFFYPRLQAIFPTQIGNVSMDAFYKGINKVQPSLIRVEADEATYNMHVMLRLELEIALMEGSLKVKDLPDAWNTKMKEYLGVVPPNDSLGVLQDVHWSGGMIGYFPTYALGNLISAQLWEKINKDIPRLDDQISKGEFNHLLDWLRKNIHQYGAKYEPQEMVQRVTGSKIDPNPYIRYLETKFGEIYGL
ncbi:MAG TPA: carboxypeptidase M32 [Longilinea sp.]|nr:carboxypeptidase M32 [Longilinea sp.]